MELSLFAERPGRLTDAFPDDYVMLDTETTGLRAGDDHVLEIGAIRFRNGEEDGRFSSLMRPEGLTRRTVSRFITGLTGITYEMVSKAPPAASVMEEFAAFLGDDLIMGYNTAFDFRFLRHECNTAPLREVPPPGDGAPPPRRHGGAFLHRERARAPRLLRLPHDRPLLPRAQA